jgi:hypothetical protein
LPLGDGDIACRVNEFGEVGVGHRMILDPERVDAHGARGPLFGVVRIGSDDCCLRGDADEIVSH